LLPNIVGALAKIFLHQIVKGCCASFASQMLKKSEVKTVGASMCFLVMRDIVSSRNSAMVVIKSCGGTSKNEVVIGWQKGD
jgi:hypothetical protein